MSKHFVKGNTYVFVAKKCKHKLGIKVMKEYKENGCTWIDSINGQTVDYIKMTGYLLLPEWCKCIKQGRPINE